MAGLPRLTRSPSPTAAGECLAVRELLEAGDVPNATDALEAPHR